MTTPPDDLEEKVDLVLENLTMREKIGKLHRKLYISISALVIAASIGAYTLCHRKTESIEDKVVEVQPGKDKGQKEDEKPKAAVPTIIPAPPPPPIILLPAPPAIPTSYDTIASVEFKTPFALEYKENEMYHDKSGRDVKTGPVMYVFDAADRSIHRFSNTELGYAVGKYILPSNSKTKHDSYFSLYCEHFPRSERSRRLFTPFLVDGDEIVVDYLDGSIVTFTLPDLHFKKREVGGKLNTKKYGRGALPESIPTFTPCAKKIKKEIDEYVESNADYAVYSMLQKFSGNPQELFNTQEQSFTAEFVQGCRSPLSAQTLERINLMVQANGAKEFKSSPGKYYGGTYDVRMSYSDYSGPHSATASLPTSLMRGKDHLIQRLLYHYFSREEFVLGSHFWPAPNDYVLARVQTERPAHFIHYNDPPSRFPVRINKVIPFQTSAGKRIGACGYGPVIAFNDKDNELLFGYICDNGDLEPHRRIPYSEIGVTSATSSHIIDRVQVGNRMYYLEQGIPRVKIIEVKDGG